MDIIAISIEDMRNWGCPNCGYQSGYSYISVPGASTWTCGECGYGFIVLASGVMISPLGVGSGKGPTIYPKITEHPRKGTPSHGKPDKQPAGGGEFFKSRGIGVDMCTCFVCTNKKLPTTMNNIAAFVQCRKAGERVVALFQRGARLDYREREPDYVQVKIGACDKHLPNLRRLDDLTHDGVITQERINQARV